MSKIIDLFSGCGGLSVGFIKNGHIVLKALEYDANIAKTYQINHANTKVIVDDIKKNTWIDETKAFDIYGKKVWEKQE